jgi:hypothetical protein
MSAGYLPLQKKRSQGKALVTKADLFEGSMTAIPVNKTALVTASKSIEDDADLKAGARNSGQDSSRLQQIHDLAVENGAVCAATKAITDTQTSTDDDSVDTLTDDATEVAETAQPDPEASAETSTDEATTSTAVKAVDVAAPSVDELAARVAVSETAMRLAFGG